AWPSLPTPAMLPTPGATSASTMAAAWVQDGAVPSARSTWIWHVPTSRATGDFTFPSVMASDAPRMPPSPARSRLGIAALVLLAFVLAIGLLLLWLLGTASGTRTVFSAVSSLTNGSVQAQGVAGRLSDRVTMERLVIDNPGQTLTLSDVDLSWRPAELLQRRLHVQQLQAEHLDVRLKDQEPEPDQPPRLPDNIAAPVQLQIDSVLLGSGEIRNADTSLVDLNQLGSDLHFHGQRHVLNLDRLIPQSAQFDSQMEATVRGTAS